MGEQAQPQEPQVPPITAQVTVAGPEAAVLRELAAALGRPAEALALDYAAGTLKLPTTTIGESAFADWTLFDGPPDLAAHADDYLAGGFGR
ncbi:hypothetical protein [Kitasatospora kifunensis]|uniref:Uncharacterized protein n=1 Tax=Kitasatospora kifunensis TaxID=58351 RepID=A0A7W7RAG7_KITKI|nr:hypothetical protein [Kitasatospora kifunensis]MBB4928383.1 hypothetical protein [Kitasatospora kifunensis]